MISTNQDTIAAIATSHGVGSIAIIRISGDKSLLIAHALTNNKILKPRVATLSKIYSDKEIVDQSILIYFKAPYSFTGEDIVEIQAHGGVVIANAILKEVINQGARLATAGEFSKRAFLNNKIDLTQAGAIAAMIEAKSQDSIKILNKILDGDLKTYIKEIRESIIEIIAYLEVSIDYAEEDLPDDIFNSISAKLNSIIDKLSNTLEISLRKSNIIDGYNLAIVGKPNVGKSSLLNAFVSYDRAIVSDIAGTTRDTIEESVTIGTHYVKLVDTAGIRQTAQEIEAIGIQRSKDAIDKSDIVLALFDGSIEFDSDDRVIYDLIKTYNKDIIIVITKNDLPQKLDRLIFKDYKIVELNTKQSISLLIDAIRGILDTGSGFDDLILVSATQITYTKDTIKALKNGYDILHDTGEFELISFELNEAIKNISAISRPYEYDEMLDVMFGEFCLGK